MPGGGNLVRSPRYKKNARAPRTAHARYYYTRSLVIDSSVKRPMSPMRCQSAPKVMDSHSRSASPREPARPQHRPPSPPSPPAFENRAYEHDESDPNHNDSFTSNPPQQNGHSKEPNGESKTLEAVNLELINLTPKNGSKKKDVEVDMNAANPYDEYFVPVNEHRKYMRGEKLYVTADKRGEKVGCKRPLCWTMVALVVAAIVALIVLAATGILFSNSPTTVEQYNTTVSSARALGGIGLDHSSHDHSGHDHSSHDHATHDHSTHEHPEATQPPQQTGFQNDDGTVPVPSEDSGDSSVYVPRTVEGELKIDNEEYTAALSDPESDEYRQFENNFNTALKRALFDRDTIESGDEEIIVEIVELRPGSVIVTYRIHWRSKTSSERTEDLLTPNALKNKLEKYLAKNSRMISVYHIAEDKMATRSVLDLCQINKNDCDHGCVFDEKTLEFICTCPRGQILDMNNSKKCMSIFETPDLEDVKQKEFRVLDIESTSVTKNPSPEEEKQVTDSVHVMENDNKFDWKEPTPVTTETITEKDPDLQFSHVFGHPGEKNHSNESDNPTPEPTAEPNASYEHNVEPEPEPTSEPESHPTSEPNPEPTSEPEPAAEPKPEPQATPEPQPAVTFTAFNVEKISETTPEPEPTTESVIVPKAKCSAGELNSSGVCEELATQPEPQPEPEPEPEPEIKPALEAESKSSETETSPQSEQKIKNIHIKTQEDVNEYKDINENMHDSQINYEIATTTTKSLPEATESTYELHENNPATLLNIFHTIENNNSQPRIFMTETTTESDWLEGSPQIKKQDMTDTDSKPRNIMDFINENISIGESHETRERSFKTIDNQFMAATTTSTISPTTTEDDISFEQFNKHEYALTSDTTTKTNDMTSSTTIQKSTEGTIEEEFKENPSDETTVVAILSSQESTIDNKSANAVNRPNNSDFIYKHESQGGKSNIISLIDGAKLFNVNNTMEVEATTIYSAEPTTNTKYSISKQIEYEEEESLAHVLENNNSTETLSTTEKEPVDEGVDITFDTINMLYNRSSKSIENQNKSSEPTESIDLKTTATTESDWLSESVTEINYEEIMNKMEKHDTTEANFNKIEEIMNRGTNKDDFEPDYLNSLGTSKSPEPDEPLYGMIHDYDNEDSRVKRVNSEIKESTFTKKNATNTKIKIKDTAEGIKIEVFKGPPIETNTAPATVTEHLTEIIPTEDAQSETTIVTTTTEKTIAIVSVKYSSEQEANNTTTDESSVVGLTTDISPADTLQAVKIRSEIMKNDTAIEAALSEKVSTENKTQEIEISTENTSNMFSETTSVRQYIHNTEGKTMQNQNNSMSSTANNNEPAPVWEEYETEKELMNSAIPNKTNVATTIFAHQQLNLDDIILATTSTTVAPTTALAFNKTTEDVVNNAEGTDIQSQNTTLMNNLNVMIYEISKSNHSFPAVKSEHTHSTEYEDHETDMNPFLPEVENNKSLVKKLQEGHDLELVSVNDTQNENSDDHTSHGSEKQASTSSKEVMRSSKEQEVSASADDNASLNDLTNESSSSEHEEINKNEDPTNNSEVEQKESIKIREKSEEKILPISTFLIDTDDLEVGKELTTEQGSTVVEKDMEDSTSAVTKAAEKSVIILKSLSDASSDLSVVPINEERNEEKETLKKSYKSENIIDFNDISDSRKKSDRRTLDASQLESVINNEA